jgi:hypothetical protein
MKIWIRIDNDFFSVMDQKLFTSARNGNVEAIKQALEASPALSNSLDEVL